MSGGEAGTAAEEGDAAEARAVARPSARTRRGGDRLPVEPVGRGAEGLGFRRAVFDVTKSL